MNTTEGPKALTFKEKLLEMEEAENMILDENEELVENRWYKFKEEEEAMDKHCYVYDPCPEIRVSEKELADWSVPWKGALVVSLLGKKVSFRVLENKLKRDWARKGTLEITDLPRNFYVVKFSAPEDYKHALFNGPWMLADHYLLVQRWRPFFITNATVESKVAVWVRIPELPLEFYNDRFLWRVGAKLGSLLKIDRLTSIHSRGHFARICVEIDLSKKLVPTIKVMGAVLRLEYEGLHVVCFACGRYGHKQDSCPELQSKTTVVQGGGNGDKSAVEEGNPGDKNGVEVCDGQEEKETLYKETGLVENRSCVDHAKSDRFNWLTVKKVNRQKLANRGVGLNNRVQSPKHDVMMKDVPDPKVTGSRYALLYEEMEPINMEESMFEKELTLKEIKEMKNSGPSYSKSGPEEEKKAKKVRDVKGGKNTQNVNRGKGNKPSLRPLGPRPKQFSQKNAKAPLGLIIEPSRGKGARQLGNMNSLVKEGKVSNKETKTLVAVPRPDFVYARRAGKEEMDWKGGETCDDAEVLRDLHAGIQSLRHLTKVGEGGPSLNKPPPLNEAEIEADQVRVLLMKGRPGEISGEEGMGSVSAHSTTPCQ